MLTLIISDGPDDKQAFVGSGPTESDPSSAAKARTVPGQSQIAVPSAVGIVGRLYHPTAAALRPAFHTGPKIIGREIPILIGLVEPPGRPPPVPLPPA
jgi:hypothetical protein